MSINILGGSHGQNIMADVLEYDDQTPKWTKVGELAVARTGHAVGLVPGYMAPYYIDYCTPNS